MSVSTLPTPGALRDELLHHIGAGTGAEMPDAEFDRLARAVFAHQFARNAPYRAYCERRGVSPRTVAGWEDVPAVPTDAFKAAALVCGDPADAAAVFRTSGTTAGPERRGTHYLPDLSLYDAALRAGFRAHLLADGARPRILSLIPRPEEMRDSSLSHMAGAVVADFGGAGSEWYVSPEGGIDHGGLADALRRAETAGEPVCILGTAFALVHWLDALREAGARHRLPAGSRLMDTGGFKGRSREVTREELYGAVQERLGIPHAWCVNEYGMTEMSSQFYDGVAGLAVAPAERLHVGPPWVRTQATDPETLRPLPHGETGVLRHFDLANLNSVMAIQTADLGITSPEGFRVLGRAQGAEARGCSLAMDDLLRAIGR
ncbi:long-chain fatty acid--CoA ligase [Longimicrobium sp.]|uniref:LuxE/PaaK family acyltransferase n=1 Tax=Longimicrobium sp. TaxID=2029185 RepID=UPI003B3B2E34